MKYQNPIIPGFYPDPSICRAGDDYYLVNSSFEYYPGIPVFHSKDLLHWHQIGHCITRPSQVSMAKIKSSMGIWAPTIRYFDGRFYVTVTDKTHDVNFYVHSDDPAGQWSEAITVDQEGIDPSLFFDDDGNAYFLTEKNRISQIDIKTGKRMSDVKSLWPGTGGKCPEGPHLYKINGTYYLMLAEGGTEFGHMITIARSDNLWGPYEPCPQNPILTHRHYRENQIQATGHGDLVKAHDNNWWMVFLGIRVVSGDYPPYHHLGRETFLAPVKWTDDGWPVVGNEGTVEMEMEGDFPDNHPWPQEPQRDDFDKDQLADCWNFLRNPYEKDSSLTQRRGYLRLKGSAITLDDTDSPAFVGRRQQHFNCKTSLLVSFEPQTKGDEAGLTVMMNERHHYEIAVVYDGQNRAVIVRRRIGDLINIVAKEAIADGQVTLQVQANPEKYTFLYSVGTSETKAIATGQVRYLSTQVAGGFTGVYFGMYATGNGTECSVPADFDWFEYIPLEI